MDRLPGLVICTIARMTDVHTYAALRSTCKRIRACLETTPKERFMALHSKAEICLQAVLVRDTAAMLENLPLEEERGYNFYRKFLKNAITGHDDTTTMLDWFRDNARQNIQIYMHQDCFVWRRCTVSPLVLAAVTGQEKIFARLVEIWRFHHAMPQQFRLGSIVSTLAHLIRFDCRDAYVFLTNALPDERDVFEAWTVDAPSAWHIAACDAFFDRRVAPVSFFVGTSAFNEAVTRMLSSAENNNVDGAVINHLIARFEAVGHVFSAQE